MKKIIIVSGILFALNGQASIEHTEMESSKPNQNEIQSNRACFGELKTLGCGDPGEDIHHFRSCMNNAYSSLSKNCKKLMTELYKD